MPIVRADAIPELRQFWGDATTLADLAWAAHLFEDVGKRLPAMLAAGDNASREDRQYVTTHWNCAIVAYGRCFSHAFGRRTLELSHIGGWGGDLAIHKQLMHEHDYVVVNFSYGDREVQRYAQLAPSTGDRKVTNLAFIENHRPLPAKEHCDAVVAHVTRLHDFMGSEMRAWMEELCKDIDAKYRDQLYECHANGVPWSQPAVTAGPGVQSPAGSGAHDVAESSAKATSVARHLPRKPRFSPLFTVNFKGQLRRQLAFLRRSCAAYDEGHFDDAIRLATTIRVLLHDTPKQVSLLTHMRAKDIVLLSTVDDELIPDGVLYLLGLGMGRTAADGTGTYFPKYGNGPFKSFMTFNRWWQQVVYVNDTVRITRGNIVLGAADKDGGAHIDAKLSEEYAALMALAMTQLPEPLRGLISSTPPANIELVSLRQIGYELLNSPQLLNLAL